MKTTIQELNGTLVAIFEGRLDTAASVETEAAIAPLHKNDGKDVILDCTKLEYISSSGLRIFLGLLKSVKLKGNSVKIKGMNDDLRNIFTITGFIHLFEFIS